MTNARGFSLIELVVTMVIVGVLAMIAMPTYQDYVRRGQIQEATSNLSDWRIRMEQYYQDNRSYDSGGGVCGATPPNASSARYFTYTCSISNSGQGFTATATGSSQLVSGFTYTLNDQNTRATTAIGAAWGTLPGNAGSTWITSHP